MSSSDRRTLLAGVSVGFAALVSGCGFEPIHGEGGVASNLTGKVALGPVVGRIGYYMRQSLERSLGDAGPSAPFVLEVTTAVEEEGLAITRTNDVTRFNYRAEAAFALRDRATGKVMLKDKVESFSAYNATASVYATRVNRRDIERRVAIDLGDRIFRRLAALEARRRAG